MVVLRMLLNRFWIWLIIYLTMMAEMELYVIL